MVSMSNHEIILRQAQDERKTFQMSNYETAYSICSEFLDGMNIVIPARLCQSRLRQRQAKAGIQDFNLISATGYRLWFDRLTNQCRYDDQKRHFPNRYKTSIMVLNLRYF
jgi:hypothetical protein